MRVLKLNRMAAAVGIALATLAVGAQAAPAARAAHPNLVNQVSFGGDTNIRSLLSATGIRSTVAMNVALADTANNNLNMLANGALVINNLTPGNNSVNVTAGTTVLVLTSATFAGRAPVAATPAAGDISIVLTAPLAPAAFRINATPGQLEYTADNTAATPIWTPVQVQVNAGLVGSEIYTDVDGSGTLNVGDATGGAITAANIDNALAPTPTISTTSAAGGALVNGFAIDTGTPITLAAAQLLVQTANTVTGNQTFPGAAVSAPVCATSVCTVNFPGLGALATAADFASPIGITQADADFYTSANFNTGVSGGSVDFRVDGVNASKASYQQVWNVSDGAASRLANSGGIALGLDAAEFPNPAANVIADGAAPALVGATTSSLTGVTNLALTFSENMSLSGNTFEALREVTENVLLGANSLAALNLNADGNLAIAGLSLVNGQDTLTITGVQAADVGTNAVTVRTGIALVEPNDAPYIAAVANRTTTAVLDSFNPGVFPFTAATNPGIIGPDDINLTGGLAAAGGITDAVKAPSATALAITLAKPTIEFGSADTDAKGFPVVGDTAKVGTVLVRFAPGKEVKLNTGFTAGDLANNLVLQVNGDFGGNPIQFQLRLTGANIAINAAGNIIAITLPTNLIYSRIDEMRTMDVQYLGGNVPPQAPVLVGFADSTVIVVQAAAQTQHTGNNPGTPGTEQVVLPLSVVAGASDTLLTQSITSTVTTGTGGPDPIGSRITAYLAVWVDGQSSLLGQPLETVDSVSILSGNLTNGSDRVGTNLAIEFVNKGAIENLIRDQLNAVYPAQPAVAGVSDAVPAGTAKPITVYVKLIRSNDAPTGQGQGDRNAQVYLQGRAIMGATYNDAKNGGDDSEDELDPIYEVTVNPSTGAVSGRLTGNLVVKADKVSQQRGLVFLNQHGLPSSATPVGQAIVESGGSYKLLAGIDPTNDLNPAPNPTGANSPPQFWYGTNFNAYKNSGAFLLLVHEQPDAVSKFTMLTSADPSATNFLAFTPNLLTGQGTRTTLPPIDLTNVVKAPVAPSSGWALYGLRNPAKQAIPAGQTWSVPRTFVGVNGSGEPVSLWAGDGATSDLAMTMANNAIKVATEVGNPIAGNLSTTAAANTLSTITNPIGVAGAVAFGWSNDNPPGGDVHIDVLQSTSAVVAKVGTGWSAVATPSAGLNVGTGASQLQAVINVGAQTTDQFTWIAGADGALPTVTPGTALFVYCKAASCNVAP